MKHNSLSGHVKKQQELTKADESPVVMKLAAGEGGASFFLLSN